MKRVSVERCVSEQGSLFGYVSPVSGEVSSHPPLCRCGQCSMPVEEFGPQLVVALIESTPAPWEEGS